MQKAAVLFRYKFAVIVALATVLLALGMGFKLRGDLPDAWKMIYIPANSPLFSDTRTVTNSIDCVLHGQDPYTVRSFDPWNRLYNYPPVWLEARYLGITSRSSNRIGTLLAIGAICAYLMLFNARTAVSAIIVLLALISRCVLFAVERGNTDQAVFFLLVLGFFLIDQLRPKLRNGLTVFLLTLLTVLKVYPIVAVTVFLDHRRGVLKTVIATAVALAALVLTSGHKLIILLVNTPRRDYDMSFGTFPFFYILSMHTVHSLAPYLLKHARDATFAAVILGGVSMIAGAAMGSRLDRFLPRMNSDNARGAIAIACLSIFCFTFAAGSNYDYRLIYLLGVLAYLVEDMNREISWRSVPAALVIVVLLWKPFGLSIFGETFDGLVFIMGSAWLGNSIYRTQAELSVKKLLSRSFRSKTEYGNFSPDVV